MRSGLDDAAGLPESERLVQLGPEGTDTAGGLTGGTEPTATPHGLRGDRHHPASPFPTAPRRRFRPPSTRAKERQRALLGHLKAAV